MSHAPRDSRAQWVSSLERLSKAYLVVLLVVLPHWKFQVLLDRPPAFMFFEVRDFVLYATDVLWWGALIVWLLSRVVARPRPLIAGPLFIFMPLVGLVLLGFMGVPQAVDPPLAFYHVLRLSMVLLLYLMLVNLPLSAGSVTWALAASTVLQAVVALRQFELGQSIGLTFLGEAPAKTAWAGASVIMLGGERFLRAHGLTQHPNLLGGCLSVFLLIMVGYYLSRRGWQRLTLSIALGVGLAALLVTFSRSAWLGLAVGTVAMVGLLAVGRQEEPFPWRPLAWLAAGAFIVLMVFVRGNWALLEPRLGLTVEGTEIRSADERKELVGGARVLIEQRPMMGVGLGNFSLALYRLAPQAMADYPIYQPVHNVYLLATAELGIPGGILWVVLLLAPWVAIGRCWRRLKITFWLAGLSGAMAALATLSSFDHYVLALQQGRLLFCLVFGLRASEWQRCKVVDE